MPRQYKRFWSVIYHIFTKTNDIMVLSKMNFQSEDETLVVEITKNDEYGWDVEVLQFPIGDLMGS